MHIKLGNKNQGIKYTARFDNKIIRRTIASNNCNQIHEEVTKCLLFHTRVTGIFVSTTFMFLN